MRGNLFRCKLFYRHKPPLHARTSPTVEIRIRSICLPTEHSKSALGTRSKVTVRSSSNWNFEMLVFVEGGKPEYPEKIPWRTNNNAPPPPPPQPILVGGECCSTVPSLPPHNSRFLWFARDMQILSLKIRICFYFSSNKNANRLIGQTLPSTVRSYRSWFIPFY